MDYKPMTILSILLGASLLLNVALVRAYRGASRERNLYKKRWRQLVRIQARQFVRASSRNLLRIYAGRN